ncbi:DUF1800 domain-containing protein [Thiothrix nivea]|uniref:Uncharacterized protein n=1 Tax=Thiothrix nivea (strain ATCC 35100 / DSM 5205 / JP2) TaxID=870187 RepID=A0A656HKY5_THINJ|nr:DUF1800 domain-containing protein [Thiothrix nivea]EIJ36166.1 protein of unknown function DUF1800 [Thiothrix nivea DSM 5205]
MPRLPQLPIHKVLTRFLLLLVCLLPLLVQAAVTPAPPNLMVLAVDGTKADTPLASYDVHVREVMADGSTVWRTKAKTDADGQVSFALDGLGAGKRYVLNAKSTRTAQTKQSAIIEQTGEFTFRVGSPLLNASLVDAVSGEPLAGVSVTAYRQEADKSVWSGQTTTDTAGLAVFEIEALSQGVPVSLKAKVFNGFTATQTYAKPGDVIFALGDTVVTVLDGVKAERPPLAHYPLQVRELRVDGKTNWFAGVTTDAVGQLRLNLPADRQFRLEGKSTFNNSNKVSQPLQAGAQNTFQLGTPLLQVSLKDAVSGMLLPNTMVTAYRIKADGTSAWRTQTSTDASGVARFDLPELLEGEQAQLFASPYNVYRAASPVFSQPGNVDFPVGDVRVMVMDNTQTPAAPLANQSVTIVEKMADGKEVWRSGTTTDADGRLRLTLFTQGAGREYLLKTKSPFNQAWKTSQSIKQAGDYTFAVGSQPLPVTLKDVSTGKALAGIQVTAYQVLADGKLQWKTRQTTDANGKTSFDLPELSNGGVIRLQATVFNNFGAWSQDITSPAAFEFGIGSLQVTVRDGTQAEGALLPNLDVHIRENLADGTTVWFNKAVTDTDGKLKIDLPGLDSGRTFFLQAMHPVTKRYKSSQTISTVGEHTFMVGTRLLTVNLRNAVSQTPLADKDVTLHEVKVVEGSSWPYVWTTSAKTDANGVAILDSDKLSQPGLSFAVSVTPYNAGRVISAHFLAQTYSLDFPVGAIPVTLLDKDNGNAVMPDKRIDAYEIMADGKLQWRKNGVTDAAGQVIFDLETLRNGTRHVFKASNPFANNKYPYSQIITAEGALAFAISRSDDGKLDLKPPLVEILAPSKNHVGDFGFELSGKASDDKALERVEVKLVSGSLSNTRAATLDKTTGNWKLAVGAADLQSGQALAVTATALDTTGNASSTTRHYQVLADSVAPSITVTSHTDNESVLKTGFLLQGTVTDDTSVSSLQVTVTDASGTVLVAPKALNPTPAGDWAYALANGILSQDSQISVSLTATDATGKHGTFTLALNVVGSHEESRQLLSRTTFGITDALLQEISRDGAATFLEQQLNPAGIDDSLFQSRLSTTNPVTLVEFQSYTLQHMIGSRRQLQEVMAWFWDNHFNTDFRKTGNKLLYELAENDAFRANALGNFRSLLDASAKSPAMLYYLDSVKNVREDSNENYARELLELHTVGVDGGYTQKEVEVLAEVFTGWQVQNDRFFFNAAQHNSSNKVFWGNNIPAGGVDEGERVLDILARHPSTAHYICSKLVTQFVSDQLVNSLQERCTETFLAQAAAPDQIAQVLRVILTSPEFYATANINSKVKTPLEFVVASARAVDAQGTYADLPAVLKRMGMDLFQCPVPTGYSDTGDDWVSPVALQERVRFVNLLANARTGVSYVDTNLFKAKGSVTAESIASDLLNWTIGGYYAELEWQTALEVLNAEGSFDPNASNADARIRETIGTVLSYPEFNYQ